MQTYEMVVLAANGLSVAERDVRCKTWKLKTDLPGIGRKPNDREGGAGDYREH